MPNAVVKYNIRNMFGDLDAVIAGHPSSLFKVRQATKELWDYFYNGGVLTENPERLCSQKRYDYWTNRSEFEKHGEVKVN